MRREWSFSAWNSPHWTPDWDLLTGTGILRLAAILVWKQTSVRASKQARNSAGGVVVVATALSPDLRALLF